MLDQSPRNFFDVLDENGIYVTINYEIKRDAKKIFTYHTVEDNQIYEERIPCERAAVMKAFERLN
jgi:hypothetical protein